MLLNFIMRITEAQRIVGQYSQIIRLSREGQYFQPVENLPCSAARIKFAICSLLSFRIQSGSLDLDTLESLIVAYSHLAFFTDADSARQLNEMSLHPHRSTDSVLEKIKTLNMVKVQLRLEIQGFIQEEAESLRS